MAINQNIPSNNHNNKLDCHQLYIHPMFLPPKNQHLLRHEYSNQYSHSHKRVRVVHKHACSFPNLPHHTATHESRAVANLYFYRSASYHSVKTNGLTSVCIILWKSIIRDKTIEIRCITTD